jgi:hypothetical protein
MLKVLPYLGSIVGTYAGWALGRQVGLMTAYLFCIVGGAAGLYFGRRLVKRILGES